MRVSVCLLRLIVVFKELTMRRNGILLVAVVLLSTAGFARAQEGELHGAIDATYLSKFIWRGFDFYDDKSAIQPSLSLDLFGTGFGLEVQNSRANSSKFENSEWLRTYLYYDTCLLEGEAYVTNFRLGYYYYNFPDNANQDFDLQEVHGVFSWPEICPFGVVPTYILVHTWPSSSGSMVGSKSINPITGTPTSGTASGWIHVLSLDYPWTVACPITGEEKVLNLHSEFVYNDGVGPGGQNVDNDWSHAVFGISTDFTLAENLSLIPGFFYQSSWEDSVNTEDEAWAALTMKYTF